MGVDTKYSNICTIRKVVVTRVFREIISNAQSKKTKDPAKIATAILGEIKKCNKGGNIYPVPVVDIANKMGFVVKLVEKLPNHDSGAIIIDPELAESIGSDKCILINNNIKCGKRRFVLAHELGHYLFDFDGASKVRFKHAFVRSYNIANNDLESEKNANKFANELLMPEKTFREEYEALPENLDLSSRIVKLSEKFGTTTKSIEYRITELKLHELIK